MIFGTYPCCDGDLATAMPERTPAYAPEDCPHCGAKVWHVFSRLEPMTYIEADFLAIYDVDYETRQIRRKKQSAQPQGDPS